MRITQLICLALPWMMLQAGAQSIDTNKPIHLLSLEDCLTMALQHNFDVQITRLNPVIARATLEASYGLYDPSFHATAQRFYNVSEAKITPGSSAAQLSSDQQVDTLSPGIKGVLPTGLTYDLTGGINHRTGNNQGTPFDFYDGQASINLRQPLLRNFWTDPQRTQIKINKKDLKIAEWIFYRQLMDTMAAVQQAYYELVFAIEDVKVNEKAVELANRLVDEEMQRVKIGVKAPLDEQLAASEAARALGDLIRARQARQQQENVLKNLIVDNFMQWHPVMLEPTEKLVAVPASYDLQDSWTKGLTLRPEYARAKLELERQDLDLKLRINQLYPQLDAFGVYGRNTFDPGFSGNLRDLRDGEFPTYTAGLALTIPFSNRDARFRRDESRALKEQLRLILEQIKQGIIQQIDDNVTLSKANYERVSTTRAQREYAEAALAAEEKKFANGVATSFDVLDRQSRLTTARSAEIRALADYIEALIKLYRAEGSTLERLRMNVEIK
jgi:HAE1 family hydrophobic/amphiphilic exporter-1